MEMGESPAPGRPRCSTAIKRKCVCVCLCVSKPPYQVGNEQSSPSFPLPWKGGGAWKDLLSLTPLCALHTGPCVLLIYFTHQGSPCGNALNPSKFLLHARCSAMCPDGKAGLRGGLQLFDLGFSLKGGGFS